MRVFTEGLEPVVGPIVTLVHTRVSAWKCKLFVRGCGGFSKRPHFYSTGARETVSNISGFKKKFRGWQADLAGL